jgi:hypothetical protein
VPAEGSDLRIKAAGLNFLALIFAAHPLVPLRGILEYFCMSQERARKALENKLCGTWQER